MIDRFGENIEFTAKENGKLTFTAQVQISPQFFVWCCSFGEWLKEIGPASVVEQIKFISVNFPILTDKGTVNPSRRKRIEKVES